MVAHRPDDAESCATLVEEAGPPGSGARDRMRSAVDDVDGLFGVAGEKRRKSQMCSKRAWMWLTVSGGSVESADGSPDKEAKDTSCADATLVKRQASSNVSLLQKRAGPVAIGGRASGLDPGQACTIPDKAVTAPPMAP